MKKLKKLPLSSNQNIILCPYVCIYFQHEVLAECRGRGIGKDLFQDPCKLHLTLGTLVLLDDVDRKTAAQAMQSCQQDFIEYTSFC